MQKNALFSMVVVTTLTLLPLFAEDHGELIFTDDFERSESQEEKDEADNGWGSNSRTRAQGNKQVDLRDGTGISTSMNPPITRSR